MKLRIKLSKKDAIRMDILSENILDLYRSVESPYVLSKTKLTEAYLLLRTEPKSSWKLMEAAYSMMLEEARAAQIYNRYKYLLPQISDERTAELDEKYKRCLREGRYGEAKAVAERISKSESVIKADHSVHVRVDGIDDAHVSFAVVNGSNTDITIKRLSARMDQRDLHSDTVYPCVIHKATRIVVRFDRIRSESKIVKLAMEYSDEGITKTSFSEHVLE